MAETKLMLGALAFCIVAWSGCMALECCAEYKDQYGTTHPAILCQDYCCADISLATLTEGKLRSCCSDESKRVPAADRTQDCIKSWIEENIWVPIVAGIAVLIIIIVIVACCCCCCRR